MTDRKQMNELESSGGEEEEDEELLWVDDEDLEKPTAAEYIEIDLGNSKDETEEPLGKKHKRATSATKRGVRLLFDKHDITRSTGYHWSHVEQAVAACCALSQITTEMSIVSAMTSQLPHYLTTSCNASQFRSWDGSRRLAFLQSIQHWFRCNVQELPDDGFSSTSSSSRDTDGSLQLQQQHASSHPSRNQASLRMESSLLQTLRSSQQPLAATRAQICALCMAALLASGVECRLVCAIDPPSWRPQQHWSLYKVAWQRGFKEQVERAAKKTLAGGSGGGSGGGGSGTGKDKSSSSNPRLSAQATKRARLVRGLVYAVAGPEADEGEDGQPSEVGGASAPASALSHSSSSAMPALSEEEALALQRQQWHGKHRPLARNSAYWLEVFFPAHTDIDTAGNGASSSANRWVHMDPLQGLDAPLQVEAKTRTSGGKLLPLQYACAVDPAGRAVDVTRRYASRPELSAALTNAGLQQMWATLLQQRTDDAQALLVAADADAYAETETETGEKEKEKEKARNTGPAASGKASFSDAGRTVISLVDSEETDAVSCAVIDAGHRAPVHAPLPTAALAPAVTATHTPSTSISASTAARADTSQVFSQRRSEEAAQIKKAASKAPKPTTLAGYKSHPDYVLNCDGHMRANEVLLPNARPIGLFKGHAIYRREDVAMALSKKNWRKLHMRDVLPEHADSPICTQSRTDARGGGGSGGGDKRGPASSSVERFDVALYGIWQTSALRVDPVRDGVIPVNAHGNVEVWDMQESLVPRGSRLISAKDCDTAAVRALCADMQIPCVSAVVGFERVGTSGAAQAVIGGVVVLEEHYDMLRDAAGNLAAQEQAQAAARREAEVAQWWASLVQRALLRSRLKTTYGH